MSNSFSVEIGEERQGGSELTHGMWAGYRLIIAGSAGVVDPAHSALGAFTECGPRARGLSAPRARGLSVPSP